MAEQKDTWSNSITLYDRNASAVQLGYVGRRLTVSFSPIFDSMRGKDPKKGDKVYDHERKQFVVFSDKALLTLKRQIIALEAEEIDEAVYDTEAKTFTIFAPGVLEDQENLVMQIAFKETGRVIPFEFREEELEIGTKYGEKKDKVVKESACLDWEIFKEFILSSAPIMLGSTEHAAKSAVNSVPGGGTRSTGDVGVQPPKRRLGAGGGNTGRLGNGTVPKGEGTVAKGTGRAVDGPEDYFDQEFEGDEV